MPQFAQSTPSINSSSSRPKEAVEEPTEVEMVNKMNSMCLNIIQEYEELQNIEVCIYGKKI